MARSVYKICGCRHQVKCRHPWWFSYKRRGTSRVRKSLDVVLERHVDSKTIAEHEADRLRRAIAEPSGEDATRLAARTRELLGLPASIVPIRERLTVAQLLAYYRTQHLDRTATAARQAYQIGALARTVLARPDGTSAPLGDWLVVDVTADALTRLRAARSARTVHRREQGSNVVGGAVAANRDLRLLRAAFNWAIKTDILDRTPFRREGVAVITPTKERARSRRLQPGEGERLLPACNPPLRAIVEAALETGCRRGELLSLQWHQVQLVGKPEIWLPADKTKTGQARRVPISKRLRAVLEMRRDALRAMLDLEADQPLPEALYVFGNEIGQRVGAIKTAWRLACGRAKVQDLHFHDLRREAGSRWMEGGVSLATIQKWLGHTNIAQTSTYLATTTAGEHEAMRQFEEQRGQLTPIDTKGATPPASALM